MASVSKGLALPETASAAARPAHSSPNPARPAGAGSSSGWVGPRDDGPDRGHIVPGEMLVAPVALASEFAVFSAPQQPWRSRLWQETGAATLCEIAPSLLSASPNDRNGDD
jgi:hypothetical protein